MEQEVNLFEKIHLFDRFGKLSDPLENTTNGMVWKTSLHMGTSFDGTSPAIDVRYSCEDFGSSDGCYVILKCNDRRMGHFFQVNKSVVIFRQAYIGIPFEPKEGIQVNMIQNMFEDWIFVEWKGKESPGFNLEPYYFYDPILYMSTTHLPMIQGKAVIGKYMPSSTFDGPGGVAIPFEFDPEVFRYSNKEVPKIIENLNAKTEDEMRELRDVLGYFYHDFISGLKDSDMIGVQLLTHLYGFHTSVTPAQVFSWEFRNIRVSESTPSPGVLGRTRQVWHDSFSGVAKVSRNTCLRMQRDFSIDGSCGSINFTMFKETVKGEDYISFGAYFVMAPFAETYRCSIMISSAIPSMLWDVERNIKFGENTIAIPTFYKEADFPGPLIAFDFAWRLEKLATTSIPSYVVFPGAPEVTLKFDSKKIRVSEKFLTRNMKMFKVWFQSEYFVGLEKGAVSLREEEFEGIFHVLDAAYHYSKQLTVDSFKKFGCAADQYLCPKMFAVWERSAIKCRIPDIQKFITE